MTRGQLGVIAGLVTVIMAVAGSTEAAGLQPLPAAAPGVSGAEEQRALLERYCFTCHDSRKSTGGLALDAFSLAEVGAHAEVWEKVVRKLRGRLMPPLGRPRPDGEAYDRLSSWLEAELDSAHHRRPNPGRTETFHRLNRAEYRNAIRDLLALELEIDHYLPADDASYGFDNMAGVLRDRKSVV